MPNIECYPPFEASSNDIHPVKDHIGAVKDRRKAHPSVKLSDNEPVGISKTSEPLVQPVLFSNIVKASLVETLFAPALTNKAIIVAIAVPAVY